MYFRNFIAVLLLISASLTVLAEVPPMISYQGRLTDASGDPVVDGLYILEFKIYGSEDGSDLLWSSDQQKVDIVGGLFRYDLGSNTPFPNSLFSSAGERYLSVVFGEEPESDTRIKFVANAYALQATIAADLVCTSCVAGSELVDDAVTASKLAANAVSGYNVADGSLSVLDILDNVGVARSYSSSCDLSDGDLTAIDSVTITVPAPGYVLTLANCMVEMRPNASTLKLGNARFALDTYVHASMTSISAVVGYSNDVMSSVNYQWHNVCFTKLFEAGAPGDYQYYFLGDQGYDSGSVEVRWSVLTAIYIPSLYGDASTFVSDLSGYEGLDAEPVSFEDNTAPEGRAVTGHVVDLRQLEANALRKRLEAEVAENELLRAKLKAAGD